MVIQKIISRGGTEDEVHFFYDETEHSRKINYETVTANNYYDNFITGIVGWKAEEDECISDRYLAFESKYDYRKKTEN